MKKMLVCCLAGLFLAGQAMAADPNPAARRHVKQVGNTYYKYTSKLKTVINLNFTLGFDHTAGKQILDQTLEKIRTEYGNPFTIKKFTGPSNGAGRGLPSPVPTLADLISGEVIVSNNISTLNDLPKSSSALATAIETAIKTNGRGVISFHGSGDGMGGWSFYTDSLHPVLYNSHGNQSNAPVYLNETEAKHVVNDSILLVGTKMDVPMGTDASGNEVKKNVTIRQMKNEWYRFGRNLMTDNATKNRVTCFMRYDPTNINTGDLGAQYKYKGGNPYLWMVRIGAGKAVYLPPGHDATELTTGNSFDGGSGDLVRMYAQLLFFMAGYDSTVCGTDCVGLPIANQNFHLTGAKCDAGCAGSVSLMFDKDFEFKSMTGKPFTARLTDVSGRVVATHSGKGVETVRFNHANLKPGVYIMSVKVGKEAPVNRRYLVPHRST